MRRTLFARRSGQALVMVTVALFAIVGLMGLAVDLSWSYFLQKTMQAAADSAALSAVQRAKEVSGTYANLNCSTVACYATATSCSSINSSSTANLACLYAARNGFSPSTSGQEVTIVASDVSTAPTVADGACSGTGTTIYRPPTTGCVDTLYWVTVRVSQQVPQLFSAVLGNYTGNVSVRSTAAIVQSELQGSLLLLNRATDMQGENPPNTAPTYGTNLDLGGSGTVTVPGGILLSSGSSVSGHEAGRIQGGGNSSEVVSPYTRVRSGGTIGGSQYQNWRCTSGGAYCAPTPTSDGPDFYDPMRDRGGQPPLNTGLNLIEVPQGTLTETQCPGWVCPPGLYIATTPDCGGCVTQHPSGVQIRVPQNQAISFQGGSFGDWMFVGGLSVRNGATLNMGPGRYVFAGVGNSSQDSVLDIPNGVRVNGGSGSDAGRILIFTDFRRDTMRDLEGAMTGSQAIQSYGGQMDTIYQGVQTHYTSQLASDGATSWSDVTWAGTGLGHGKVSIQAGNNASSLVNLYGLQKGNTSIPADLRPFAPVAMWQDQHNSYIRYTQTSQIDIGCAPNNTTLDRPCTQTPDANVAPQLEIWATPHTTYQGAIYQPRGAWTVLQASGNYLGALQIITGSMKVQGSPNLSLTGLSAPITIYTSSLIE